MRAKSDELVQDQGQVNCARLTRMPS
jgi:hypothetical protein